VGLFNDSAALTVRFFDKNRGTLQNAMESVRSQLQPVLKDTRPPMGTTSSKLSSVFGWIFDNPVIKILFNLNPFTIIMDLIADAAFDAAGEEFGALFKLPSMEISPRSSTTWHPTC
jgi:hypothetical protein